MSRLGACTLLCFFSLTVAAQQITPQLFNGLRWRLIGPFRGGRAVAVSGESNGQSTFYFGAVDGGIWKSTDAGVVWTPVFDNQPVASIGALAVAPSDSNVLYAGTGESDIRSNLATGDGVYKSTDGGKTWTNVGLKDTRQISRIFINPRDPNHVVVAALGHAYAPNEERGIFRSTDGGQSWDKVLYKGPSVGAADLAMSPDEPNVLLAAMWEAHRPPWSTYGPLTGPGSGLYLSRNDGKTWKQLTGHGLPAGEWGRIGVAIASGNHAHRLYAAIEAKDAGLYRSDDGGENWTLVNKDPRITSRAWYFSCITVDPNDPDVVYIPNVALYKLSDGGKTLSIVRGAPGGDDYHQLWIDPANSLHMALASDQGTSITLNGGRTWSSWYNQPTAQFYHVVTDNAFPYHVYGAQQDSGTAATVSQTDHNEIDTRDWFTVGGSESGYIALDPKDPNILYISGTYGTLGRFDRRTMQTQNIAPAPVLAFSADISKRKYRDPWTPVLVFSPAQPNALYLGTQYVMRTLDGGLHWQTISPDLTGAAPRPSDTETPATPPNVENAKARGYGVVYTIAPSPLSAAEIWAGSDTGLVHLTRDAGKSWSDITPPGLSDWSKITQIECSHFTRGEAYAAVDRHRLDDMRPYLYRTRDYGKTWTPIVSGISDHTFLNSMREDPKHQGLLFAGTEFGVYVSFDDGDHWLPLQLNLPVTSIRDLAIRNDDLIVATHGRAFWILDDITPLRQLAGQSATAAPFFYKPAIAVRMTSDHFPGTPLPPEEPQAQNPPRGAYLDYYLENTVAEVQLTILDSHGQTVRQFSSHDKPLLASPDVPIAARWLPKPQLLSTQPGMHRFIWDLRYGHKAEAVTADTEDTGLETWIGPLALPGTYKVKLSVDGKELVQPLTVTMDPRSQITAAALNIQFNAAQHAFNDLVIGRTTAREVQALQAKLTALAAQPAASPLHQSVDAAQRRLGELLAGPKSHPEEGLESINQSLTMSLAAIEGADRLPPSQVIDLSRDSSQKLKTRVADWRAFQRGPVAELNQQLRAAGLTPLE